MSDLVVVRRPKSRFVELALLIFAMALAFGGYALTHLNIDGKMPGNWPWVIGTWAGLTLVLWGLIFKFIPYSDPVMLPCVILLNGLGLAMIHRIDQIPDPVRHYAERQLIWTIAGMACFAAVIIFLRKYRILHAIPNTLAVIGLALLLLPMVPGLGASRFGANIWVQIGGMSFQPAEIAKLVLTVAFASYLVDKEVVLAVSTKRFLWVDWPRARDLGPILIMWLASLVVLVHQTDLGTSLLFFGLFVVMLYVATGRRSWPIIGGLLFASGAGLAYLLFGHVRVRVSGWLDPFADWERNGQLINGQFSLAWGGLLGRGWGLGRPGLTPLPRSDFIATSLGEEIGIAGLMAIILVYGIIAARGLRTALASSGGFEKLLATGLSTVFGLQVFLIIGGVTRLLPLTGLTTPFMSQGGSSIVSNWILVGFLMVLSHHTRAPQQSEESFQASLGEEETAILGELK